MGGAEQADGAREGERLTAFEELKRRTARVWSSAPWERVSPTLASVHEHIVRKLAPAPGVRFLDVATGTGAVALRAARAGAEVTGVDLASGLVETARRLAAEEGLRIRLDVGDAEALPYPDGRFDAVASAMGAIFAPDHAAAARELARVCRPGGRLALSAWRPGALFREVASRYAPPLEPGQGDSEDWGREEYAESRLGDAFALEFEDGDAPLVSSSGADLWELLVASVGPFRARAESLERDLREEFRREFVDLLERHREDGEVRLPGPYLLVVGTRR